MSTIWGAAREGDCARLRALIGDGVDLDARYNGLTPLLFAACHGRAEAVELLVQHGADVELMATGFGTRGGTALHYAAEHAGASTTRCIEILLAAGADANVTTDVVTRTPLQHLLDSGRSKQTITSCAALLINSGARVTDRPGRVGEHIISAIEGNNREVAKMLLRAGAVIPHYSRRFYLYDNPANALVRHVQARGGWKAYASNHKRVLVGLVAKCTGNLKPHFPDDAAGLVVEFYCPIGGY